MLDSQVEMLRGVIQSQEILSIDIEKESLLAAELAKRSREVRRSRKGQEEWHQPRPRSRSTLSLIKELGG
jgi:hypothetical protein